MGRARRQRGADGPPAAQAGATVATSGPGGLAAGLLWALNLLLGLTYALATPAYEASDELWHMPFVLHLARGGGLPVQRPGEEQPWRQEGSQPPLYYALAAAASGWVDTSDRERVLRPNPHPDIGRLTADGNHNMALHRPGESPLDGGLLLAVALARGVSVLLASLTVPLTFLIGRSVVPDHPWVAVGAAALVAFNPMFLFIQGSVNNDNAVVPLATLGLLLLVRYLGSGLSPPRRLALGLVLGLAALAKLSGAGLAALAGAAILYRRRLADFAWILLPAAAVAGWWFLRNLLLYGEPLGLGTMVAVAGPRHPPPSLLQLGREWWGAFMAYWGFFGGMNVPAPDWLYRLYLALTLLGLVGFLVWMALRWRAIRRPPRPALLVLLGWAGLNLVGLVRWTMSTIASQGRLLFPSIAALSIFLALGLVGTPAVARRLRAAVLGIGLLALAIWVPGGVIRPAYALPRFLPPREGVRAVELGGRARIVDWEVGPGPYTPGQAVPVTVTWQGLRPMEEDYSVFVHLVAENEIIIGQRDVYPGGGMYPTSLWEPGVSFADTYRVPIPASAPAPATLTVMAGLYRLETGERLAAGDQGRVVLGSVRIVPATESPYPNPMRAVLGERVALVGYRLEPTTASPGQAFILALYWQALGPMDFDYTVFTHVLGPDHAIWAQEDRQAATSRWRTGQVYQETYRLQLAAQTPPGVYDLEVGMYRWDTLERLELLSPHGQVEGDRILLTRVRVQPAPPGRGQVVLN